MKKLSIKQQILYDNATRCHICKNRFGTTKNFIEVRDHDHYTGNYRGATHSIFNLRYFSQTDIPVVFYNGSKYDFNLIITELANEFRSEMRCIPMTTNNYMSFSIPIKKTSVNDKCVVYNLQFIDSMCFMNESLSNLVDDLSDLYTCKCLDKTNQDIKVTWKEKKVHIHTNIVHNSKEKQISEDKICKIAYSRCKTCNCKNKQQLDTLINNFPSTYKLCNNNIDKFLLLLRKGTYPYEYMDNWDKFNSTMFKRISIRPLVFVSTPGLALEAMLKITNVKLKLLTDVDMVLMVENGIRGGLTQVAHKYASADNKYLPDYNQNLKSTYLQYFDTNNLYGYTMTKKLSLNAFKWSDPIKYTSEFIKNYNDTCDEGYLLELDVEYPKHLHNAHSDLTFLPERRKKLDKPFEYEISDDIKKKHYNVYKELNIIHEPENKLVSTIRDKIKYIVCISTLKQALNHGLILKKVHRLIEYN